MVQNIKSLTCVTIVLGGALHSAFHFRTVRFSCSCYVYDLLNFTQLINSEPRTPVLVLGFSTNSWSVCYEEHRMSLQIFPSQAADLTQPGGLLWVNRESRGCDWTAPEGRMPVARLEGATAAASRGAGVQVGWAESEMAPHAVCKCHMAAVWRMASSAAWTLTWEKQSKSYQNKCIYRILMTVQKW